MARLKQCELGCGGLVSSGGNRHGKGLCNPRAQSSRRSRKRRQFQDKMMEMRGTGVPKGDE